MVEEHTENKEQPEKRVDETWKAEVAREKERMRRHERQRRVAREDEAAPPPADFAGFVSSLVAQAYMQLGLLERPAGGQRQPDFAAAKYTIDLLNMLKQKTKGNLAPDEQKLLDNALYELKMRFVEATGGGAPRAT